MCTQAASVCLLTYRRMLRPASQTFHLQVSINNLRYACCFVAPISVVCCTRLRSISSICFRPILLRIIRPPLAALQLRSRWTVRANTYLLATGRRLALTKIVIRVGVLKLYEATRCMRMMQPSRRSLARPRHFLG